MAILPFPRDGGSGMSFDFQVCIRLITPSSLESVLVELGD
jgi:hypothetical protein